MIIAGYAGVGKSTFAERYAAESIDLVSMPYKFILPKKQQTVKKKIQKPLRICCVIRHTRIIILRQSSKRKKILNMC